MGFIYVLVGCVFLFNPTYGLIDVLPDFIGVVLILIGMSKTADLNSHISAAYGKMKCAAFVAFGKLVCLLLMGVLDSTMMITLTLAAGVLECVFLIPAFAEYFEGLGALETGKVKVDEKVSSSIKALSAIFFVVRATAAVVPDAAAMIYETSAGAVKANAITPERLRGALLILFFAASLVLGVFWLVYVFKFINPARKDEAFVSELSARYKAEVLDNGELMLSRRVGRFCLLASLSVLPLITLRVDHVFFLPEFAFGILMLAANLITEKYAKDKKFSIILGALIAVGAGEYAAMFVYSDKFGDLYMPFGTEGFYPVYIPLVILTAAFFALFCAAVKKSGDILIKMTDDAVGLGGSYTDERRRDIDAERKRSIKNRITFLKIISYVYAAVSLGSVVALPFFEAAWLARPIVGAVLFAVWLWVTRTVAAEAENTL